MTTPEGFALPSRSGSPSPSVAREFARRVGEIDGQARILLPNHHAGRWCSIQEAVESGASYMVRPRDDLLILDGDADDSLDGLLHLATDLRAHGIGPVVTASGRPGRGHLIAIVRESQRLVPLQDACRNIGFDVRGDWSMIRPPHAPHHLAAFPPSRPADPGTDDEALDALSRPWERFGLLSRRMSHLLRYGDTEHRYLAQGRPDRSRVVQAIVTGGSNRGFTADHLFNVLMDPVNVGGQKVREIASDRSEAAARKYVDLSLTKAERLPPMQRTISRTTQVLHETRQAALVWPFGGRGGPTEFAVLCVHISIAEKTHRLYYDLNVRDVALRAGVSRSAAGAANHRLAEQGWLRVMRKGGREWSTTYLLRPSPSWTVLLEGGVREYEDCPGCWDPSLAIWGDGGVGKIGFLVWTRLCNIAHPVVLLASRLGRSPATVTEHLHLLLAHGLARPRGREQWMRGPVDPELASERLLKVHPEVEASQRARRERYEAERTQFDPRRRAITRSRSGTADRVEP